MENAGELSGYILAPQFFTRSYKLAYLIYKSVIKQSSLVYTGTGSPGPGELSFWLLK